MVDFPAEDLERRAEVYFGLDDSVLLLSLKRV